MSERIEIRPITATEIAILAQEAALGQREKHEERLSRQQVGEVVYLVAWGEARPLGHALLKWGGAVEEAVRSRLIDCPDIEDVLVIPERRCQGIGTQLLKQAEQLALQKGYRQIGLSVGVDNLRAHLLYERLGYESSRIGTYWERGEFYGSDGQQHRWEEEVIYLAKAVAGNQVG